MSRLPRFGRETEPYSQPTAGHCRIAVERPLPRITADFDLAWTWLNVEVDVHDGAVTGSWYSGSVVPARLTDREKEEAVQKCEDAFDPNDFEPADDELDEQRCDERDAYWEAVRE